MELGPVLQSCLGRMGVLQVGSREGGREFCAPSRLELSELGVH